MEITNWEPTEELRRHTPDQRHIAPKLQRKFICTASDGSTGEIWAEVHEENTFIRVESDT